MAVVVATAPSNTAEADGLQLAPLTSPHPHERHHRRAGTLQSPPEEIRGQRAGVDRCGDKVEEVDCESEVGDKFGAGYEEEKENHTIQKREACQLCSFLVPFLGKRSTQRGVGFIPDEAVQHPHQPQYPPDCGISAQIVPSKDQIQREGRAIHHCREQYQYRRADIPGDLEQEDLADDEQWREVGSRPRWVTPARGHELGELGRIPLVGGRERLRVSGALLQRDEEAQGVVCDGGGG